MGENDPQQSFHMKSECGCRSKRIAQGCLSWIDVLFMSVLVEALVIGHKRYFVTSWQHYGVINVTSHRVPVKTFNLICSKDS